MSKIRKISPEFPGLLWITKSKFKNNKTNSNKQLNKLCTPLHTLESRLIGWCLYTEKRFVYMTIFLVNTINFLINFETATTFEHTINRICN